MSNKETSSPANSLEESSRDARQNLTANQIAAKDNSQDKMPVPGKRKRSDDDQTFMISTMAAGKRQCTEANFDVNHQ